MRHRIGGDCMQKYEVSMKLDEVRRLVKNNQYRKAKKVLEKFPIAKVKNIKDIYLLVDVYTHTENYTVAKELLIRIYKKVHSRRAVYQLVDISMKQKDVEQAIRYLRKFYKIAPRDPYILIFRYGIAQLLEKPLKEQVRILEMLKKREYTEKWAYELALLYYRTDRDEKCIKECDTIILWFGEGVYVEKAKLLKQYYEDSTMLKESDTAISKQAFEENVINKMSEKERKETALSNGELEALSGVFELSTTLEKTDYKEERSDVTDEMYDETNEHETISSSSVWSMIEESEMKESTFKDFEETPSINNGFEGKEELRKIDKKIKEEENTPIEAQECFYYIKEQKTDKINETLEKQTVDDAISYEAIDKKIKYLLQKQGLDDIEYKNILGSFLKIKHTNLAIYESLERILNAHNKNSNLIIEGRQKSGKTCLAKRMAKILYTVGKIQTQRIGIISYDIFMASDLKKYMGQLQESCMIIENIEKYSNEFFEKITALNKHHCVIILEVSFSEENQPFELLCIKNQIFPNKIPFHDYTQSELYELALEYVSSKEYHLDSDAENYLKEYIYKVADKPEESYALVMNEIANAYHCAKRRNKLELLNVSISGNYKDADFMSVKERDFTDENG